MLPDFAYNQRVATNLVNIGEVIIHGMVFDPKNSLALRTMDLQQVLESIPRLFDLLDERSIDYVLVGGIAMLVYVEGRNTQDIDLIMVSADLERLPELEIEDRNKEFVRARFGELRVDVLLTDNRLFEQVRSEHSVMQRFAERDVRCATVAGLLTMKLFALPSLYRQGQLDRVRIYESDIEQLIARYQLDASRVLHQLSQHVTGSDLNELRGIVVDTEQRIARARERFGDDRKGRP